MSRMSVRTFLVIAKKHLQQAIKDQSATSFVIGNESADLDSITSALVYGYIQSSKLESKRTGKLYIPVTNIPAADLALRPELSALLKHADIKPSELITLDDLGSNFLPADKTDWTIVDHNALQGKLGETYRSRVQGVIDHHEDEKLVPKDATPRVIEKCASCSSLVTNYLRDTWQDLGSMVSSTIGSAQEDGRLVDDFPYASTWDAQVAKLALASILIDSINMKAEHKVTNHDKKAVRFLEAKINISHKYGKDYDRDRFFNQINDAKSNIDDLSIRDILRKDYKQWQEGDLNLGISSVVQSVQYLQKRDENLTDIVKAWGKERSLNLFAIMTAHNEDDGFHRQIVLYAFDDKGRAAAEKFVQNGGDKLQLKDAKDAGKTNQDSELSFQHFWDQHNLEASRKRVGPLLRENMS
ncbi:Putative DDH domain, DHHA2 domain, DHHA2 domain superfamily, DHH phosphoesterase superfamily [Septoria linicola]|uniref:DDH domain, DHHA2 domain, DHHA2 domain superfamily, DHH phosphoesterase superfamily n=1 Tax=Septoria linicola TaxID=215465 RepID=A0A9Q9AR26_9PEZI|nr:putative DDH domain, DHHA2 domain, DHHA2 domain superfamily, DHH phosphoesterase superfamily [Septoria linicola]USW50995.1 Putative DDH domain, DHHA2 domain, DHHA2 domain superfamily, DHH phosphoesterase superfamily [Septoria linicola]